MNNSKLGKLPDRELLAGVRIFNNTTTAVPTEYALTAAQATELNDELDGFETELDAYEQAQADEDTALRAKRTRRKKIVELARQQFKLARSASGITDEKLAAANLDAYDDEPTPSKTPTTAPFGIIEYGKLKHTIYFRDSATPDSEAKPQGMQSCEIWRYIGDTPPTGEADFDYVADDTNSPYTCFYTMADAGKKVWYILRWKSKSGEKGEWSETIEATVNG